MSDKFGGQFPIEEMQRHGILVEPSAAPKSELYKDLVPVVNAGRLELLDNPRLVAQLCGLERRTARGGRDSIDHAPGAHDDLANVVGLLAAAARAIGLPPLPATFTRCNREASGITGFLCYLRTEPGEYGCYLPSGDPCCRLCPGHRAVLDSWREDSRGLDLRAFRWQVWGDSDFSRRRREGRAWAELRQNRDGRGGELIAGL